MPTPHPDESFGNKDTEYKNPVNDAGARRHRPKGDINPENEVDVMRLRESMDWSQKAIAPFRQRYYQSVEFFAGNRYGINQKVDKTPMNLVHLAVEIWLRQLAANTPRCLVLTRMPELKTAAFELEIATDYTLSEIGFGSSLSECVRMAIFMMGVMKVGITSKYLARGTQFTSVTGQPYADPVLFEDWLHDMTARRQEEWDWCGNKYRLPYEMVMDNPDWDKKIKDQISPKMEDKYNSPVGLNGPTTNSLSSQEGPMVVEYKDTVELYDLFLPRDNLIVTLPMQDGLGPLETREWEGPDNGPYHILGFSTVPGNIIPSAPAQQIHDIQDVITRLFNQLADQALRQKTVTVADGKSVADGSAATVAEASDGQVIQVGHIDAIKEMKYGGIDPNSQAFLVYLREVLSYMGGNIDAMGGLAQQAGTLGQEELLVSSSSEMIRDMQSKVVAFTKEVVEDIAWYMYTDPQIELPLVKKIDGYGDVPFLYGPGERDADYFNFHFEIQPYSLQTKGPQQRLQTIMQLMQGIFLPLAPQLGEMGMTLNLQKFVELVSKYGDLPEIQDLIASQLPTSYEQMMDDQAGRKGERPTQSPVTQRNYTRRNVSGENGNGSNTQEMMNQLLAAGRSNAGG